ncbi:DbpA RNA binding domain-containing protein [Sphingomonas sp. LR61]
MQLPTIDDVNETRLTRFDDAITAALEDQGRIAAFRDVIAHYVEHHDVPSDDVAAALAVVAQGDSPLLLTAADDALRTQMERDARRGERDDRGARDDRGPRSDRGGDRDRDRAPRRSQPMTAYRIEVGRRHRVEPRQIVGALANEGGLRRDDFGAIRIQPDFSIVELPADMDGGVLDRLTDTRISGKLIEIKPDRRGGGRRDERPERKPRY